MKKLGIILAILLTALSAYYLFWRAQLSDDVKRIEATIEHHNQQFRAHNRWVTLKADGVSRTGFPLKSYVRVNRPTLTFVSGEETFGVSLPFIDLDPRDADMGGYEVIYQPYAEAVYAKNGQAPEEYTVTAPAPLRLLLRAQADSRQCSNFPGVARCAAAGAHDPLITYAVELPGSVTLTMELNGDSKQAQFTTPIVTMPIYMRIPADMDRSLELFVHILREAHKRPY